MIIVTKSNVSESELANIRQRVESLGLKTHITRGSHRVVIACVGEDNAMAEVPLLALARRRERHAGAAPLQARLARVRRIPTSRTVVRDRARRRVRRHARSR